MIFHRFYDHRLAQASYLVGCQQTGEAIVVDPTRDVQPYIDVATREGLRVTHATETHIHADFVSGARELVARTGARLFLSGEGDVDWTYAYAAADGARLLKDGDHLMVGNVRLDVRHTPGHTPEHLTFLVTDTLATAHPMGALTGDFLFAGDVGRPDLLERAAHVAGTMEAGARTLFRSLQRFVREQPDYLQLWPGHGAGSACGKALGTVSSTTLGYEKIANWGLGVADEDTFVAMVLAGQPEPPTYFAAMKRVNRAGPTVLGIVRRPARGDVTALAQALDRGTLVVDLRSAAAFAEGHIPGTINIPLNESFSTWAGWLVPHGRALQLIAPRGGADGLDAAVRDLAMIGLDDVTLWYDAGVLDAWRAAGRPIETVPQMTTVELDRRLREGTVSVIDVRGRAEWEGGHIPGAPNIPVGHLTRRLNEVPADRPVVVHCQGGARSAIAASVLRRLGRRNVIDLVGGFAQWASESRPTARQHSEVSPPLVAAALLAE